MKLYDGKRYKKFKVKWTEVIQKCEEVKKDVLKVWGRTMLYTIEWKCEKVDQSVWKLIIIMLYNFIRSTKATQRQNFGAFRPFCATHVIYALISRTFPKTSITWYWVFSAHSVRILIYISVSKKKNLT